MNFREKVIALAKRLGVETDYLDSFGKRVEPPLETFLLFTKAMGFEIGSEKDIEEVENVLNQTSTREASVLLVKEGKVELPCQDSEEIILTSDDEKVIPLTCRNKFLEFPPDLPFGYYFLNLFCKNSPRSKKILVIHSPMKAFLPRQKHWGLHLGLYSVQSPNNQGIGDLADLARLQEAVIKFGASYLGLLPLHLMDKENPLQTSPYFPLDRFAFDPVYLPLSQPQETYPNQDFEVFRNAPLVDYQKIWKAKEKVFRANFKKLFSSPLFKEDMEKFIKLRGERFALSILYQSIAAKKGNNWRNWPREMQKPTLKLLEHFRATNEEEYMFHVFLQWLWNQHLEKLTLQNKVLAFDLPLGFAPQGAEEWVEQESMVSEFSVGAPPDPFSPQGQNWGFHPFNPHKMRENHYQHFISLLKFNMQYAKFLRFDHILSLKRLFWIPKGAEASEGLYVKYPTQELLSILTLESKRASTVIIGEDLGTIPPGFRELLQQHDILSTRVFYFETDDQGFPLAPRQYPVKSIFLLNTHDMPPLRGFIKGCDLKLRRKLKILGEEAFARSFLERKNFIAKMLKMLKNEGFLLESTSEKDFKEIFQALVVFAMHTPSVVKALSLEDLLEKVFQPNLPGTTIKQYPNWRKKHQIQWEKLQKKIAQIAFYWNEPNNQKL
ncbi:4-alpha-glucanotransferase [Thermatribacter velox]|uniref:4-alpha-glucanotransferase n=1 Tax=Thermatribacter velox TaxID=3039681 RepID=A0ABZ2YG61_9BACT